MTTALVWKVYREQLSVWLTMAALAFGAIVLRQTVLGQELHRENLLRLFCLFAYIYGLVVGAVLLAGEREAGTATFLRSLPATRVEVWKVKGLAGVGMVLALAFYLWLLLLPLELFQDFLPAVQHLGLQAGLALVGFAWGLFFSGWTQTSLGAIFAAIAVQVVVTPLLLNLVEVALFLHKTPAGSPIESLSLVCLGGVQVVGLIVASGMYQSQLDRLKGLDWTQWGDDPGWPMFGQAYTNWDVPLSRPDIEREWPGGSEWPEPDEIGDEGPRREHQGEEAEGAWAVTQPAPAQAPSASTWRSELIALLWLDLRQAGPLFLALAGGAFVAGMLPLWVLGWPVLTLVLGVIAGVSVFAGEQAEGARAFLVEQRLPMGKIWAVKVGVRLAASLALVHLLLLPAGIVAAYRSLEGGGSFGAPPTGFPELAPFLQMGPYLTLGLGHGFSVGCLCGLVFRKPVIGGVIATGAGLLLLALWVPSLLVGGLHVWQYWGLPVVLLVTVRFLLRPWANGQLGTPGSLLRLAAGLTLAGLWFAGALAYRVYEVPLVQDRLDLGKFERQLEIARKTETGFMLRNTFGQITRLPGNWRGFDSLDVPTKGWPAGPPAELVGELDEAFRGPWVEQLAVVVRRPLGLVEDVTGLTPETSPRAIENALFAVHLLLARGLQQQARGDPESFVEHLATGLALVRQARHLEPTAIVTMVRTAELDLLRGVDRWLERLAGRPDLLRRVLALLREHEEAIVAEGDSALHADYLIALNAVLRPESWACSVIRTRHADGQLLASLVASAWRTPWEEARLRRLIRQLANEGAVAFPLPPPLTRDVLFPRYNPRTPLDAHKETSHLTARELMVALRLFQAEIGRPAQSLEELTPNLIPSVPVARTTGEPFSYQPEQRTLRIKGETFVVPLPPGPAVGKEKRP
jgi:hypothetical protein